MIILAHGGLGWWDEMIFGGIAIVFLAVMVVMWVRSRNTPYQFDDQPDTPPVKPSVKPDEAPDRFKLD